MEVPIQQIGRNFAHFSLVRAIFLHPDTTNQAQLLHKSLDSLVIQRRVAVTCTGRYAAIAVSSSVFMVDCRDFFLGCLVLVCAVHPFQMIVERRTGQLSDGKKNFKRMFLPQLLNYQRFLRWRRSSSKTKACKFFK